MPGAPGLLWPRGAAAGVVVPPVWLHVLAGSFVAYRPPMVPEGPVVLVALVVCGWCGEWPVAWGVEVDGLEDVEVVGLRGVLVPDGAGARTFVALVAAVVRGRGWVLMVATLRVEVEELWCRASPAVIRDTAALPYVPGCGGGTSG